MSEINIKFFVCDYCKTKKKAVKNISIKRGWATASGFYGEVAHSCDKEECIGLLQEFAIENGLDVTIQERINKVKK